jgi:3,4-dihydroxyphenylacetate 2,3-dioxygenase
MGKLSLVAKVTHVPTMLMSEEPGRLHGTRDHAINGHREIRRRMLEAGVDTVIVIDTHWVINAGYHINANHRFEGIYTSNEFPQFIQDMGYAYEGNSALGDLIAQKANDKGIFTLSHQIDSLELEYGTLVPMRYMNEDSHFKVISIGGWCTVHNHDSSRQLGEAIREAVEASDSNVALLASGSLSHAIWANELYEANNGTFTISSEFNRQMDIRVMDLWQNGEIDTFLKMLPDYADHCSGEGHMHDTAMMFGALGWDSYTGKGEMISEYFPSSGTGQVNFVFPVQG